MAERRGTAASRGYGARWARASAAFLQRQPLCQGCLAAFDRSELAVLTDHVLPARDYPALFWDEMNWQGACGWHHNAVKAVLEAQLRAGLVGAAALRLTSPEAVALARALRPFG